MKKLLGFVLAVLLGFGLAGGLFMHAPTPNPDGSMDDIQSDTSIDEGNDNGGANNGGDDTGNVGGGEEEPPKEEEPKEPEEVVEPVWEWQRCYDYSELVVGDKVIFVAEEYDVALGTAQNSSNRGVGTVMKDGDMVAAISDVQVITLQKGVVEGSFAFWVETGYLCASSSTSNQLKTRWNLEENTSWTISVNDESVTEIVAQGDSERKYLMYNAQSTLFSCYASSATQRNIVIYKLVEMEDEVGGETDE